MADTKYKGTADSYDRSKAIERKKLYDDLFDRLGIDRTNVTRHYPDRDFGILEQMASAVPPNFHTVPIIKNSGVPFVGDKTTGRHWGEVIKDYTTGNNKVIYPSLERLAEQYGDANLQGPDWYDNPEKYWGGLPLSKTNFKAIDEPFVTGVYDYGDKSIQVDSRAPDMFGTLLHELDHFKGHTRNNPRVKTPSWSFASGKSVKDSIVEEENLRSFLVHKLKRLEKSQVPMAHLWTRQEEIPEMSAELFRSEASQPSQSRPIYTEKMKIGPMLPSRR